MLWLLQFKSLGCRGFNLDLLVQLCAYGHYH